MFPQEYYVILRALKELSVEETRFYFKAFPVRDGASSKQATPVTNYFNRRFYKFTDTNSEELHYKTNASEQAGSSLIAYEGPMMPTKTELKLAQKCNFDFYTITNFSFMDLAQSLKLPSVSLLAATEGLGESTVNPIPRWVPAQDTYNGNLNSGELNALK